MIRRAVVMILCLMASVLGIGLFLVKHEVKSQESHLAQINRNILRGQEAIHVLNAEWSYLNDPARLRTLAEKHLGMNVVKPTQIATLDTLGGKLRGDIPDVRPIMIAKVPTPAVQPGERTEVAKTPVVVTTVGYGDVASRRVVPSRAYSASTNTPPSYTPSSGGYAAAPGRTVGTTTSAPATQRRVIVVPSPALARASGYGGNP